MLGRYYAGTALLIIIAALFMWAEEHSRRQYNERRRG